MTNYDSMYSDFNLDDAKKQHFLEFANNSHAERTKLAFMHTDFIPEQDFGNVNIYDQFPEK